MRSCSGAPRGAWRERLQQALLDEATAGARATQWAHLQSNKQLIAEGSAEAVAALIAEDPNMALIWDSLSDEEQSRYATRIESLCRAV